MDNVAESGVFISWIKYHGRSQSLGDALGYKVVFVETSAKNPIARYIASAVKTVRELYKVKPQAVAIMMPPIPLLIAIRVFSLFNPVVIIADLHSGVFLDPKWSWALPSTLRLLRRCDVAVVTNPELRAVCEAKNIETKVVHDPLPLRSGLTNADVPRREDHLIVVPLSYSNDEPIQELLAAARLTPNLNWKLTGHAPEVIRDQAPSNVTFTGYLEHEQYEQLLQTASVLVALTNRPHTMQRAAYEALAMATPIVTSDFAELRTYFGSAAEYTPADSTSIARAVLSAYADRTTGVRHLHAKFTEKSEEEERILAELRSVVARKLDGANA
ncbi:hypothetical protein CH300_06045 [Rhodococcus sp. 15-1154-1]|nr:glycosyltransferase [Rhodococcus sp. 15-1154-1]OZF07505.1 hypothetical protein CH300_06045 [Rhodococcus sp. 15-1154-1]